MRVYSREFRLEVVRRIQDGEKVPALSRELGIRSKLLYEWKRRVSEGGEANLRERGRPRKGDPPGVTGKSIPREVADLERALIHQQLIIEFFRRALQRVETLRQEKTAFGAMASSGPSRK